MTTLVWAKENLENPNFNQYWYGPETIDAMVEEIRLLAANRSADESLGRPLRVACVSTPSVHFALDQSSNLESTLFEWDSKLVRQAGDHGVMWDYSDPAVWPEGRFGMFDLVVMDPPFITEEVIRAYSTFALKLADPKASGYYIFSSIAENEEMINAALPGCKAVPFKPYIKNLVYQYSFYCNFAPSGPLSKLNKLVD